MAHVQTIRPIHGAKTAALLIHGIAGTPDHFRTILPIEELLPEDWSVYNILLPGHGNRVEDFSRSSMAAWQAHVQDIFDELCLRHEQVVLIGHSMGTLFSVEMALRRPEKVAFLLLINVPLRVGIKAFGVRNLIRFGFGKLDLSDPVQEATSRVCSIAPTKRVWKYLGWIPRLLELIRLMHGTGKCLSDLCAPAVAFQSKRDELVSARSDRILQNSGTVETVILPQSTHFYYHPKDIETVRDAFRKRCPDWNRNAKQ